MNDPTRRNFMAGATATATAASVLSLTQPVHAAPGSELKLALVGCGGRGTGACAQDLENDGVKLVAMADAFEDKVDGAHNNLQKKYAAKMDVPKENRFHGFDAYKKAIDAADIVILATSPGFRPIHFEYAVQQGKHVFMEKPVATDMPGIRKVLAAAKQADEKGLKVVVGLQRHYQEILPRRPRRKCAKAPSDRNHLGPCAVERRRRLGATAPARADRDGIPDAQLVLTSTGSAATTSPSSTFTTSTSPTGSSSGDTRSRRKPDGRARFGGRKGPEYGEKSSTTTTSKYTYASGAIVMNSQCRHIKGCANGVDEVLHRFGRHPLRQDGQKLRRPGTGPRSRTAITAARSATTIPTRRSTTASTAPSATTKPLNNAYYGAKSTATSIIGRLATYSGKVIKWDDAMNSEVSLMPKEFSWDAEPPVLPDANGLYPVAVPGKSKVI